MQYLSVVSTLLFSLLGFTPVFGQNAYITSVLINSCNGSCAEGDNEIIFGNTGSGTLLANPSNLTITYGTAAAPTTTYTDAFTNNPATTASLNSAAGCALFIDAAGTTIPANASFVVVRNTICTNALTWSGLCGSAPIYIIYSTDPSWSAGGNFGNGTGTTRYFRSTITTSTGTSIIDYNYNLPGAFGNDGAYANWNATGGSAILYGDNDCQITPTSLPITITDFKLEQNLGDYIVTWITDQDEEIESYELEYTNEFQLVEVIDFKISNQSNGPSTYRSFFQLPMNKSGYLQLKYLDKNNRLHVHGETLVITKETDENYQIKDDVFINLDTGPCVLMDIQGRKVAEVLGKSSFAGLNSGFLFIHYSGKPTIKLFLTKTI